MSIRVTRPVTLLATLTLGLAATLSLVLDQPQVDPVQARAPEEEPGAVRAAGQLTEPRDAMTAPAAAFPYGAPAGSRFDFDAAIHTDTAIRRDDDGAAQRVVQSLAGTARITVLARRGDELALQLDWPACKAELRVNGQPAAPEATRALAAQLRAPSIVRMRADGATLGFRFPEGLELHNTNWVRTVTAMLRQVVPGDAAGRQSWRTRETDGTGEAEFEYRWLDADGEGRRRLHRRKLHALAPASVDRPAPESSGEGEACLDAALGWLRSCSWKEASRATIDAFAAEVRQQQRGAFELAAHDRAGIPADFDWDAPWQPVDSSAAAADLARRSREAELRRKLQGIDGEGLLRGILALVQGGKLGDPEIVEKHDLLVLLLADDPELVAELARRLRSSAEDEVSRGARAVQLSAMAKAGTREAQSALAGMLSDPTLGAGLRESVAMAMFVVETPGAEAVAAARRLLRRHDLPAGTEDIGLLLAGKFAGNAAQPADQARLRDELVAAEVQARETGRLDGWIHALGNSADPNLLARAKPYLDHENQFVRQAAARCLGMLARGGDPAVGLQLAKRIPNEPCEPVRAQIAGDITRCADLVNSDAFLGALCRDASPVVRRAVVEALAERRGDARAAALIRRVAEVDPSPELRRFAGGLLRR